jgi:prefoldin subunit 4
MNHARATKRLEIDQATTDTALEDLNSKIDVCAGEMKELKVALYAKFGSAINLDE